MTNAQPRTLVFRDQAGEYYLVPQETLEQGRVPEERKAELEQLMEEADDTQGHFGIVFFVGVAIGYFGTKAIIEGTRDEPGKDVGEWHAEMLGTGRGLTGR